MKKKLLKHANELAELGKNDEFIATIAKQLRLYAEKITSETEDSGGSNPPPDKKRDDEG